MVPVILAICWLWAFAYGMFIDSVVHAVGVVRYVDPTAGACTNNYSIANRDCTGSDGNSYATLAAGVAATGAGDILYVRQKGSNYAESMRNTITPGPSPSQRTIISAYPGESVTIAPTSGQYVVNLDNRANIAIKGFKLQSGTGTTTGHVVRMNGSSTDVLLEDNEITGATSGSGVIIAIGSDRYILRRNWVHTNGNGHFDHGGYLQANDGLVENNLFENNTGRGVQWYSAGAPQRATILWNTFKNNCNHESAAGKPEVSLKGSSHIFRFNDVRTDSLKTCGIGVSLANASSSRVDHNTVTCAGVSCTTGVDRPSGATNNTVSNSIVLGYSTAITSTGSGSVTTTNKTTGSVTDCLISATDRRLKQGTNSCRGAGTAIDGLTYVGAPDQGAFEQGAVSSAVVASGFIEVTISVKTPGVLPASGITAFTIANGTSTGTPVVSAAIIKPGSDNIVQLTITGFTGSGTCTVSYGAGNLTDSGYVGLPSAGIAQGVNSQTNLSVSGTCDNSAGGAPPTGSLHVHHTVDEGSGTSLNDETANNLDSTISSATWTTGFSGSGLSFASGQDQRVTMAYGNGVNATSQSFSFCVWVKPNSGIANKIVMGPPVGTDMRMYIGIHRDLGTWGIGVGSSTVTGTGASEFSVSANWSRMCLLNDASTDTVTLAKDGVKGTSAAAVKSSASVTSLAGHFLIGCGFDGGTTLCGDYLIDEPKVWTLALSDAQLLEDFESYTPPGGSVGGYAQKAHRWQRVRVNASGNPANLSTATNIEVIAGGAVAIEMQVDCTGGACNPLAVRLHASDIAGNTGAVAQSIGAFGLAMWGHDTASTLNSGGVTCCITGALTPTNGVTILDAVATDTFELAQDSSKVFRWIVQVGSDQVGETFNLFLMQDNGAALSGTAGTSPSLTVVSPKAGIH